MSQPDDARVDSRLSRRRFLKGVGVAAAASAAGRAVQASTAEADAAFALKELQEPKVLGPGAVPIELNVNGAVRKLSAEPRVTLLSALRDRLDHTGAKLVCDRGACGACTVIVDGELRYSCMTLAVECQGAKIETVEGLSPEGESTAVTRAFAECDALQCGFCTPGFVMTITHHLRNTSSPTMESVREACRGNLCRCGTYTRVFDAALVAATGGAGLPAGGGKEGGK